MKTLCSIRDLDVKEKKVIVRVDLNLPRKRGKFSDHTRIIRIIPTINYLRKHAAKIILISHFGRPNGVFKRELSLAPLVDELERFLLCKVHFSLDSIGDELVQRINKLDYGEIILLENLRFYPEEEKYNLNFVTQLKELGNIFINDTFSCSHRTHSSIVGLSKFLPSGAGFLLENELDSLQKLLKSPKLPFTVIIGGSKVSTKISLILNLLTKVSVIIIAGAMANTFLAAQDYNIGNSMYEPDFLDQAREILFNSKNFNCRIILPKDVITSHNHTKKKSCRVKNVSSIEDNDIILDIGPQTLCEIEHVISNSSTLVWNGPLGAFECRLFDISTRAIARSIASKTINNNLVSVVGGGDTISAIKTTGLLDCFSYVSTGGGAFLEWLEGKMLPGIEALLK